MLSSFLLVERGERRGAVMKARVGESRGFLSRGDRAALKRRILTIYIYTVVWKIFQRNGIIPSVLFLRVTKRCVFHLNWETRGFSPVIIARGSRNSVR